MTVRGLDKRAVRAAIEAGDPFPGGHGFGGTVDRHLVTDVLGRVPVFIDRDAKQTDVDPDTPGAGWGFDPAALDDPTVVPPGRILDFDHWSPAMDVCDADSWTALPDPEAEYQSAFASASPEADEIAQLVGASIDETPDAPVAFSGGVDSAAIAGRTVGDLYVAGVDGSGDRATAERAADWLDRELTHVVLPPDRIESLVPTVAVAIGRTNPMDIAIALPLYAVATAVAAEGHDHLLLGQGADELFGGYEKIANAPDDPRVEATTIDGARHELVRTLPEQLERDVRAIRAAGVRPVVPYLDDRVIDAALAVPGDRLVDRFVGEKAPLRRAVRSWLPDPVVYEEKTAVQYGSDVADELDRLARNAGFKPSQPDHVEQYVRTRVESEQ